MTCTRSGTRTICDGIAGLEIFRALAWAMAGITRGEYVAERRPHACMQAIIVNQSGMLGTSFGICTLNKEMSILGDDQSFARQLPHLRCSALKRKETGTYCSLRLGG